jgi:hypothetical protein
MGTAALIFLIMGIIFFGIGAVMVIVALVSRNKAKQAESWKTTPGQVTSATVTEQRHQDEDGYSQISYQPVVQYTYQVNGLTYSGGKISFGANNFDQNTAQSKVSQYPVGGQVMVHYNPANPGEAVLETKAAGSKLFLILGIVFAVIGLFSCCGMGFMFLLQN